MRDSIKMIVVLSVICAIAGFSLSLLKQATATQIEVQVLNNVQGPAIHQVLTGMNNKPIEERKKFTNPATGKEFTVFPAKKNGKLIAIAMENYGAGFGGNVGVMVGFNVENDTLTGIGITTHSETPGIGDVVTKPAFTSKFVGQGLNVALSSKGGNIDGVSGATYSSAGAMTAVQNASAVYKSMKAEIVNGFK